MRILYMNQKRNVPERLVSIAGDGSQSDNEEGVTEAISDHDEAEEKEKTDQSQQTTPTTPPADSDASISSQRYILETLSMTTVTERQMVKEIEDRKSSPTLNIPPGGSPISGILKGGRLWKQAGEMNNQVKVPDLQQTIESNITSDEESGSRRSVRFIESKVLNQRDVCDGAPEKITDEETKSAENQSNKGQQPEQQQSNSNNPTSAESTEMMLTFKLGNHVLISNNSLKPNSAVRQLFPCTKPLGTKVGDDDSSSVHQYLVTAESLKAFEEAKRSKLPQIIQSGETDDSIRIFGILCDNLYELKSNSSPIFSENFVYGIIPLPLLLIGIQKEFITQRSKLSLIYIKNIYGM
ncbi:hypothetical protein AMK59_1488, partial [Oryctes borbonicus]